MTGGFYKTAHPRLRPKTTYLPFIFSHTNPRKKGERDIYSFLQIETEFGRQNRDGVVADHRHLWRHHPIPVRQRPRLTV
ncbi:hypothetical protein HanRHA438_Chr17g0820861 [Helianthus annuus]|nr:hypothetical protein HanHA89_Chr17g0712991 [Helianthus annuus]KAJ0827014.1 hypothetical protein HanRHA438_Chr17g0820861 [Helianthus annuus]